MAEIIDPPAPPVREEYEIKTEIDEAQQNLEQNLGELKDAILEKVDVKARVEKAIEEKIDETKEQAIDYAVRAREIAMDLYAQGRAFVRDQPMLAVGIIGGVVLLAGAAFAVRSKLSDSVTD